MLYVVVVVVVRFCSEGAVLLKKKKPQINIGFITLCSKCLTGKFAQTEQALSIVSNTSKTFSFEKCLYV